MVDFNYSETMVAGVAGAIVNTEPKTLVSRTVETAAGVGFGKPVAQGTDDKGCKAIEAGDDNVVGITVLDRTTAPSETAADTFAQYESARLMRSGVIWVVASGAVAAGDAVWVTLADGSFSNADAGTGGGLSLPGCRWETSAADGEIAALRVNLDVPAVAGAA